MTDEQRTVDWPLHALSVTLSAFAMNYVWEYGQCSWFIHLNGPATPVGMIQPALGDVMLTWGAQAIVAAVSGRWFWCAGRWTLRIWATLIITALVMSLSFEAFALATGRWSYTAANPQIPGTPVALTPVLQLLLLFPATFGVTGALLQRG